MSRVKIYKCQTCDHFHCDHPGKQTFTYNGREYSIYRQHRSPIRLIHQQFRKNSKSREKEVSYERQSLKRSEENNIVNRSVEESGRRNYQMGKESLEQSKRSQPPKYQSYLYQQPMQQKMVESYQANYSQNLYTVPKGVQKQEQPPYPTVTIDFKEESSQRSENLANRMSPQIKSPFQFNVPKRNTNQSLKSNIYVRDQEKNIESSKGIRGYSPIEGLSSNEKFLKGRSQILPPIQINFNWSPQEKDPSNPSSAKEFLKKNVLPVQPSDLTQPPLPSTQAPSSQTTTPRHRNASMYSNQTQTQNQIQQFRPLSKTQFIGFSANQQQPPVKPPSRNQTSVEIQKPYNSPFKDWTSQFTDRSKFQTLPPMPQTNPIYPMNQTYNIYRSYGQISANIEDKKEHNPPSAITFQPYLFQPSYYSESSSFQNNSLLNKKDIYRTQGLPYQQKSGFSQIGREHFLNMPATSNSYQLSQPLNSTLYTPPTSTLPPLPPTYIPPPDLFTLPPTHPTQIKPYTPSYLSPRYDSVSNSLMTSYEVSGVQLGRPSGIGSYLPSQASPKHGISPSYSQLYSQSAYTSPPSYKLTNNFDYSPAYKTTFQTAASGISNPISESPTRFREVNHEVLLTTPSFQPNQTRKPTQTYDSILPANSSNLSALDDFPETANLNSFDYKAAGKPHTPKKSSSFTINTPFIQQTKPNSSVLEQVIASPKKSPKPPTPASNTHSPVKEIMMKPPTPASNKHSPVKEILMQNSQQVPSQVFGQQSSHNNLGSSQSQSSLRDPPDNRLRQILQKQINNNKSVNSSSIKPDINQISQDHYGTWAPADPYSISVSKMKKRRPSLSSNKEQTIHHDQSSSQFSYSPKLTTQTKSKDTPLAIKHIQRPKSAMHQLLKQKYSSKCTLNDNRCFGIDCVKPFSRQNQILDDLGHIKRSIHR